MRSDFLVYWTGKDICVHPSAVNDRVRERYIERLVDIKQHGFWMRRCKEEIHGYGSSRMEFTGALTCFSEVRMSEAANHAGRYGLLGVAVTREYLLERWGGPVKYVRNHKWEAYIAALMTIYKRLEALKEEHMLELFLLMSAFVKGMSDRDTDNFAYLDENEWRVMQTKGQTESGRIVKTGLTEPEYRLVLGESDVRVVVFPDAKTRSMARTHAGVQSWLEGAHAPALLTVDECGHL